MNEVPDSMKAIPLNYSDADYQIDIINSTSLPTSPSKDNIITMNNLQHIAGNSLSNSLHNLSEIELLTTDEGILLKPQSSFSSGIVMMNQKRKKSNLFSSSNNYRNKVETYLKIFADTDALNDSLLADFSCALVKSSHRILLQGKLYVTERFVCFYSKIMSFENKIVVPISGITNISKEKTARVIPNAIQITTETEKYFFTSFGSRDKTFNILLTLWHNYREKKSLSSHEEKCIIQSCYGIDVDLFINDDFVVDQLKDLMKLHTNKRSDEGVRLEVPSFIIDDGSDTDTEQSLHSSNFIHTDDTNEKFHTPLRCRKQNRPSSTLINRDDQDQLDRNIPILLQSLNGSSNVVHPINRAYSQPNFSKSIPSPSCSNHEHYQKFYLDEEIDMHVDKLFNCLFTNSSFFKRFCEYRKTYDVVQASWPADYCLEGRKERNIYYTLTLKARIGPKISTSEEKQIIHGNSQQRLFYMIDTEVRNSGFPLSDCFHSINRYCLIHISSTKSRIRVSSQIVYDKSLFFASKSLIESTAKSGLADYFTELGKALKHEARSPAYQINVNHNRVPPLVIPKLKKCSSLQSKDAPRNTISPHIDSTPLFKNNFNSCSDNFFQTDRAWFLLIVVSLILCLCLSFLYSRFRQLEEITNFQLNRQHQDKDDSYNWKDLLRRQHQHQIDELTQWKRLVDNSVELIDQMKNVLVIIKSNLDKLTEEIKSNSVQFSEKDRFSKFP